VDSCVDVTMMALPGMESISLVAAIFSSRQFFTFFIWWGRLGQGNRIANCQELLIHSVIHHARYISNALVQESTEGLLGIFLTIHAIYTAFNAHYCRDHYSVANC
jgi:hypothetical protein